MLFRSFFEHVRRVRTRHALLACVSVALNLCVARIAHAQLLDDGWQTTAIGSPALTGSVNQRACVEPTVSGCAAFDITSGGADIWGVSDEFRFVYRRLAGDAVVIARVDSLDYAHEWSKAGVMIRESIHAGARHAFMLVSAGEGLAFQRRPATDGPSYSTSGGAGVAPVWLKLERRGSVVSAYRSDDASDWTLIASETIDFPDAVYVGVAVTSHDASATTTASFTTVTAASFTPGSTDPPLPAAWQSTDIGSPELPGSARYSAGTFAVDAAGADIWGTYDQFRFTYQPASGDVDLIARVASLASVEPWTKAGVMVRESLAPDAAHASVFMTGAKGAAFQRRLSTGLLSANTSAGAGSVPGWIKLERRGDVITALFSGDGSLWTVIGSEVLPLPFTFYAGLAVTSHDPSAYASAQFDAVAIATSSESPTSVPTPPTPGSTGPAFARFTPSPDNDVSVNYYVLDIFDAQADVSKAAPVMSAYLGKPAVVDGECSVDITSTVQYLPSGSYIAVISAVSDGGWGTSTPSPVFSF